MYISRGGRNELRGSLISVGRVVTQSSLYSAYMNGVLVQVIIDII